MNKKDRIIKIFCQLPQENKVLMLNYAKVAMIAENSVKKNRMSSTCKEPPAIETAGKEPEKDKGDNNDFFR